MSYGDIKSSYEYKCSILTTLFQYPISSSGGMSSSLDMVIISSNSEMSLKSVCHSMMMSGSFHMDMGMGIVHVVRDVHEYIRVCQGFLPYPNVHHQGALFGSPLPFPLLLSLG